MVSEGGGARLVLISDFNLENLARLLNRPDEGLPLQCELAPFGEVIGPLIEHPPGDPPAGAVVWTRPEAALPSFAALIEGKGVKEGRIEADVDAFCDVLAAASERFRYLLVPSWLAPPAHRGLGMLDLDLEQGVAGNLLRANLSLARRLKGIGGVFVLDASRWVASTDGEEGARLWHLAKTPFTLAAFRAAAAEIRAAAEGIAGRARKLVLVDLDDTLWGGILGDVGWEGLRLGGHDPVGEAFVDFQRALRELIHRGVVLGVVSKNDEATALEAMKKHPEMVLRPDDLAGWRINWDDKARNVVELVAELNLGLESIVFIDDNPSERGRVRESFPQVLVPDWPNDPLRFAARLRSMRCFDLPALSEEDRGRAQMYVAERQRKEMRDSVGSIEEWLESLDIRVVVEKLTKADLARATQLLNKTNQMNLTTRRLTETEFHDWACAEGNTVWTVRVGDRFGDYGLTGLVSLTATPSGGKSDEGPSANRGRIVDFLLSCRVFGRHVEESMVHVAAEAGRALGLVELEAVLVPTPKNEPCRRFWSKRSGFAEREAGSFRFELANPYPAPGCVAIEYRRDDAR